MSTKLSWRHQRRSWTTQERWFIAADERGPCGGVWAEKGRFRAEVWPRGSSVRGAYYASPQRAMQQIERYLHSHPHVTDVIDLSDSRAKAGRGSSRPDWRLAEYLRVFGAEDITRIGTGREG